MLLLKDSGTVENHRNTEIAETAIFVKCCDFVNIPGFAMFFCPFFAAIFYCPY